MQTLTIGADAPQVLPRRVAEFREKYRSEKIPKSYSGYRHFAVSVGTALLVLMAVAVTLDPLTRGEWLMLPVALVFANLVEYLFHRFEMHRPIKGLYILYERHTLQHHHFFTHEAMGLEGSRDIHMVLFPSVLLFLLLASVIAPLGGLLYYVATPNIAKLSAIVSLGYYALYEMMHTAYHLEQHWIGRLPGIAVFRRLHQTHHNLANMSRYNFNVVLPLFDLLFGTYKR